MKREYIIFGAEHYNPLGVIRSLGEHGILSIGIIIKNQRKIASKSKYLKKIHFVDTLDEGYQVLIEHYGNNTEKHFLFSCSDKVAYLFDEKYEELVDKFYFFNAGGQGRLSFYMNKYNICQLANQHGITLAKTWIVSKGDIPDDLIYPVITKAGISTIDNWKGDSFICNNESDLINAYKKIRSKSIILQQYIRKKNELCLDGYCLDHGSITIITIASTYNYVLPDTYSPYMTVSNFDNKELYRKISEIFKEICFEGIFSIEFLIGPNDELYFLEINFRNSTWSYASTVAGMCLPLLWSKGILEKTKNEENVIKNFDPFKAMVEFDDFNNRVKTGQISVFKWIKDFRKSKCKFYYSSDDKKPFLSVIYAKVKKFKKGLKIS